MRQPADWMATGADDRILEYLRDADRAIPESVARAAGFTNKHVALRCEQLAAHGLLDDQGNGFYALTDLGERYLAGELDAGDLERSEE